MHHLDKINKKIIQYKNDDIYIIFYTPSCSYCQRTLALLDKYNLKYKGYNIDNIRGNIRRVIDSLIKYKSITNFQETHKTKPIIFYKGEFVGGFTELQSKLENK